jgi:hypothetical protein
MQAQFLCPPMLGHFLVEEAKADEPPIKPCLVIAWDDHSENYLIVDRETGEQRWLSVSSVQIDCDSVISTLSVTDTQAKPNEEQEAHAQEEDESDRCPVCHQLRP